MLKRTEVEHLTRLVQPLQGLQRAPAVAILAVVVVLHDPGVGLVCPVQQGQAAAQAHAYPRRKLVRGRDKGEPGRGCSLPAGEDVDACLVDRHRHDTPSCGKHRPTRTEVPGILDPGRVSGSKQCARYEIERALGATGDDDLVGGAAYAARDANVRGNGVPQRCVPRWRLIASVLP